MDERTFLPLSTYCFKRSMSSYENVKWVVKPVCAFVNSNIPTGTCKFSKFSFNRNVTIPHIVLEPSGLSVRIIYCFTNLQHIVVVNFSDWIVVSRFVTKSEFQSWIACNQQMLDSKLCVNLCHFFQWPMTLKQFHRCHIILSVFSSFCNSWLVVNQHMIPLFYAGIHFVEI